VVKNGEGFNLFPEGIEQNSVATKRMSKQCVPGALSPPPPPRLGTRLHLSDGGWWLLEIISPNFLTR